MAAIESIHWCAATGFVSFNYSSHSSVRGMTLSLGWDSLEKRRYVNSVTMMYRVFSCDVTAAMLVSLNKGTAAMLVSPTNPLGIELYSYANSFFCFALKACSLITWVKTLYKAVYNLVYILFVIQFSLMHIFANSNAYKYSLFPKGDSPLEQTA